MYTSIGIALPCYGSGTDSTSQPMAPQFIEPYVCYVSDMRSVPSAKQEFAETQE